MKNLIVITIIVLTGPLHVQALSLEGIDNKLSKWKNEIKKDPMYAHALERLKHAANKFANH